MSEWINYVKNYAAKYGLTYKQALSEASESYKLDKGKGKKPCGGKKEIPPKSRYEKESESEDSIKEENSEEEGEESSEEVQNESEDSFEDETSDDSDKMYNDASGDDEDYSDDN